MKKYLLLLALVCLLGNRALAQTNRPTYTTTTEVKETIDFTGWNWANNGEPNANVNWENNSISSITGTNGSTLNRTYTNLNHSFFVGNGSGTSSTTIFSTETYFSGSSSDANLHTEKAPFRDLNPLRMPFDCTRILFLLKNTGSNENHLFL